MRVLFLCDHRPGRAPGQRFRFEQYLDYLRSHGIECTQSPLLNERDDKTFYGRAPLRHKALVGLKCAARRSLEVLSGAGFRYDVIFIFREALFAGPPIIEELLSRSPARMVFDYDDAVWLHDISEANRRFSFLKFADKVDRIMSRSDMVFAGNPYLADHARPLCNRVEIVPTTIDTEAYVPRERSISNSPVCIGWSGSFSTLTHFKLAVPVLRKVKQKFKDRVRFKVIGDASYADEALGIRGDPWKLDTELDDLKEIDIGLMPLPDDDWSRGKCGLKGLQYMALQIPTLMSPVGVNTEIIEDGVSGYLPRTDEEWFERLSQLVMDAELRRKIGQAGRKVVEKRFSVRAWRDRYVELFTSLERR
jgi:glycosyltransferase involved in cell wall biosynthesis